MDDPIPGTLPGEPDVVNRFARTYSTTADALRDATTELKALANSHVTVSDAVDEVREKARSAQESVDKVATRYEGASQTLYTYGSELSAAQNRANTARNRIDNNNDSARYWRSRLAMLLIQANVANAADPEYVADVKEARRKVNEFAAEYQAAMAEYNAAWSDRDDAINRAISGLEDAASQAGLNDDFWEAIQGAVQQLYELAQKYLAPLIEQLRGLLELIKSIVDLISLIVTIVALFVPALAPLALALTIASLALSAMILLCSLTLYALGKESLGRVLGDAIGLVVGIVTSKLGGSGAAHAAQGAVAGAGQTFSQVAAANGGKVVTIIDAVLEVTAKEGTDALIDIGVDAGTHVLSNGLDITVDAFPNSNGPAAGSENVLYLEGPTGAGVTWDFNDMLDPKTHSTFMMDQIFDFVPGFSEVSGVVENGADFFFGQENFTLSNAGYDAIAAS
jgi:hypothetical protein